MSLPDTFVAFLKSCTDLELVVLQHQARVMHDLPPRAHAHARLLSEGRPERETLPEPREHQRALQW